MQILCTFATKTPMTEVANSGADEPAAINVAPATSGERFMAVEKGFKSYLYIFKLAIWNPCERRYEIVVANYCKPDEHVGSNEDVDDDATMLPSFLVHHRIWKLSDSWLETGYVCGSCWLIFLLNLTFEYKTNILLMVFLYIGIICCDFLNSSFQVIIFWMWFIQGQEYSVFRKTWRWCQKYCCCSYLWEMSGLC